MKDAYEDEGVDELYATAIRAVDRWQGWPPVSVEGAIKYHTIMTLALDLPSDESVAARVVFLMIYSIDQKWPTMTPQQFSKTALQTEPGRVVFALTLRYLREHARKHAN